MPEDAPAATPAPRAEYRNCKIPLIVFGIIQIGIGGLCLLMLPLMLLALVLPQPQPGPELTLNTLGGALVVYALGAAWFGAMGVGSLFARRWARALTLAASWMGLVIGILSMAAMAFVMPSVLEQLPADQQIPPAAAKFVQIFVYAFSFVLYILVPGVFVLFYGNRHVKATCEALNPAPAWTDRAPTPILALTLLLGLGALFVPSLGLYGWVVPCFGVLLDGAAGAAVALLMLGVLIALARGTWQRRRAAWWGTLFFALVWGLSATITFSSISMGEYYEKAGLPAAQIEMMARLEVVERFSSLPFLLLWFAPFFGFMAYMRRFFRRPDETASSPGTSCSPST